MAAEGRAQLFEARMEIRGCAVRARRGSRSLERIGPRSMDARVLCVGFSSATRVARFRLGNLEVTIETEDGPLTLTLPEHWLRQVDLQLECWRREAHEDSLVKRNAGKIAMTLVQAARAGGIRDINFLISRGANVFTDINGTTALEFAVRNGHLAVVEVILAEADKVSLFYPPRPYKLLELAASCGHAPIAALLLDRGADPASGDSISLRQAAYHGHLSVVRVLLDRGAQVHAAHDEALRDAQDNGHEEVVALLQERIAIADTAVDD
jgi:Ankyrin repeats (3 copies)